MRGKIAVLGALTNFGRSLLDYLADSGWSAKNVFALDMMPQDNLQIPYGNSFLPVYPFHSFDFHRIQLSFLCLPTLLDEDKDTILQSGSYLLDCVGFLENAPCIIATLNLKKSRQSQVLLNPTAPTVALSQILFPIYKHWGIVGAEVTMLLSAGLFGIEAIQNLVEQSRCLFTREEPQTKVFPKIQAFNLIPDISINLNRKTAEQIKSILHFPIAVSSCLTPVFQGECYSVTFKTRTKTSVSQIQEACLSVCPFEETLSADLGLSTQDVLLGQLPCLSHLSVVPFQPDTYHFWLLCDSLRTGAVPNAVQIADYLLS